MSLDSLEDYPDWMGQARVMARVSEERARQDDTWGEQHWPDGTDPSLYEPHAAQMKYINDHMSPESHTWADIFLEEVYEALAETDPEKLKTELVQCAAVAVAWVEDIDQRS